MNQRFEVYLAEVAARTIKEGGTASKPHVCEFLPVQDLWCFPKYPSKTIILPQTANILDALRRYIAQNETALNESDCWLGTWVNPQTGDFYLDVSTGIAGLEKAKRIAIQVGKQEGREIVAMFNPMQNQTIFLNV